MPIATTDLVFKKSSATASAGNASPSPGPGVSLGKYVSTTVLTSGALNDLFPDNTGAENAADVSDYQCIFVHNTHATLTLQSAVAWIKADVAGGATVAIGADPTAASAVGSSSAQALTIADKNTAPVGVSFSAPTTQAAGISIGNIGPGQVKAIWVRRTTTNSGALANDGATIRVDGDTSP